MDASEGIMAAVSGAALNVQQCSEIAGSDRHLQQQLDRVLDSLQMAMRSLRRELSPLGDTPIEGLDFFMGLQHLIIQAETASLIDIEQRIDSSFRAELSPKDNTHLLYIVREALANSVRHARPSRIAVRAGTDNGRLVVRVTDDGRGFEIGEHPVAEGTNSGLARMHDRAEAVGALFQVESVRGAGTIVTVTIARPVP